MPPTAFVAIVGHGPDLEREEGAANVLAGLGASVRTLDLWDYPATLWDDAEGEAIARAIVVEALDRPDLAAAALRALRREPRLEATGALLAVTPAQAARVDPASGFDDFVLTPYVPAELYARIRLLEWRRSEFANEERMKIGALVVDRAAHEVLLDGAAVQLTAREFALLAYLSDRRGKLVTREELLKRVWGERYEGGERTVDIHVRRLRSKLGRALPLVTLRGAGYKLASPESHKGARSDAREAGPAPTTPTGRPGSREPASRRSPARATQSSGGPALSRSVPRPETRRRRAVR